ncbi:MAG: hypothetical protein ACRDO8_05375 [Nocardioidaceae bacterium]
MSWRTRPPSQYTAAKGGSRVPFFWTFVLIGLVCLAVGLGGGLALANQSAPKLIHPTAPKQVAKRERLTERADTTLGALTDIRGATLLGKEQRDVCATAKGGLLARGWYESGCGIEVSWYVGAKGNPSAVKRAVRAWMERQNVPRTSDFTWTESSGPLPRKPSGKVRAVNARAKGALTSLQHGSPLSFPQRDHIYRERVTSFHLASAYRAHRRGHPVVARVSLVAQYAWT